MILDLVFTPAYFVCANNKQQVLVGVRILYYFPVLYSVLGYFRVLERPSTTCAVNNIVILANEKYTTKESMHGLIAQACLNRGIDPNRTKLGENIIVRVGKTSDVDDLMRVGAHRAAAILVMVNKEDEEYENE